jgi:hypothetical protein
MDDHVISDFEVLAYVAAEIPRRSTRPGVPIVRVLFYLQNIS